MSPPDYWPFVIYVALIATVAGGMLGVSALLGQKHNDRGKGKPYESGLDGTGTGRLKISIRFYLVAILFVIFDLEVIYIFSWAIALRELGWQGYGGIVVFIAILIVALIYEWRMGALDWSRPRRPGRITNKKDKL